MPQSIRDRCITCAELAARQLYFRSGLVRRARSWRAARRSTSSPMVLASTAAIADQLATVVQPGGLLMAHVSTLGVSLESDDRRRIVEAPKVAAEIVVLLRSAVGLSGTLVMPTHPLYQPPPWDPQAKREDGRVLTFDPRRTPTLNGLANELFRRTPDVARSRHPLQTVSAVGPMANELLAGNLHSGRPVPHGVDSAYHRVCTNGGIVVGIGLPLLDYCTIIHVAEDVRLADGDDGTFYRERRFLVREGRGGEEWVVRERRPLYSRYYSEHELRVDLRREGILREVVVEGLQMDWLRAGDLLSYMLHRNASSAYPYRTTAGRR
jgi:aminoglycoside 3-N-acetyltransferase